MSAELAEIFGEVSPPGIGHEVTETCLARIPLPEKCVKPERFDLSKLPFFISPSSSHPRSEFPIKKLRKLSPGRCDKIDDFGAFGAFESKADRASFERFKEKNYLFFLSRHYDVRYYGESNFSSETVSFASSAPPRLLPSCHPALFSSHQAKDLKKYKDVSYVVFWGHLTAALHSGSRIVVPNLKKMTHAIYRSEYIQELQVGFDLNSNFLEKNEKIAFVYSADWLSRFITIGALNLLVVNKILRNTDLSISNVGFSGPRLVAFDFDQCGTVRLDLSQGAAWGFSARGIDRAGWVPPAEESIYVDGHGPKRWIGSAYDAKGVCFDELYHRRQSRWRRLHHHREAVHIQHYLYFKFLLMDEAWVKNILKGFVGEHDSTRARECFDKTLLMQREVCSALMSSAIFYLDLLINSARYYTKIQTDFEFYNQKKWSKDKPENEKYRLNCPLEKFNTKKQFFLACNTTGIMSETFAGAGAGEARVELEYPRYLKNLKGLEGLEDLEDLEDLEGSCFIEDESGLDNPDQKQDKNQDQKIAYLQFLILLSHAKDYRDEKAAYDPNLPKFVALRESLSAEHQRKFNFFIALFSRVKMDCTYSELFFLAKAFDILYPTYQRKSEKGLFNLGFSSLSAIDKSPLPHFFPNPGYWKVLGVFSDSNYGPDVHWAFSNFSVERLTSRDAREKFSAEEVIDSNRIGREFIEGSSKVERYFARKEACLEMAALIRNQIEYL